MRTSATSKGFSITVVLPKKGKLRAAEKAREGDPAFIRLRRRHSAVESAINALEVHGPDRCPDHGIDGFKGYVALAGVVRNIQRLGAIVYEQERERERRKRGSYKKAALTSPPSPSHSPSRE